MIHLLTNQKDALYFEWITTGNIISGVHLLMLALEVETSIVDNQLKLTIVFYGIHMCKVKSI